MFNRVKKVLRPTTDYSASKRYSAGRKLFAVLSYLFVFSVGINIGKNITQREQNIANTLGSLMTDSANKERQSAVAGANAQEQFEKQIAMEIERRIRNQVEEQVKAEVQSALSAGTGPSDDSDDPESLAGLPDNTSRDSKKKKGARAPASAKKSGKSNRSPNSDSSANFIADSDLYKMTSFAVEHSRHEEKAESEEALQSLKAKGLKAYRRKVASTDGEVTYRIYSGRFSTKDGAKDYQSSTLTKKGLLDLGKVRKLEPITKKSKSE